jgi:rubrerythrin
MEKEPPSKPVSDVFERFAEIEDLVSKLYFRFSHLFLGNPEIRDFWWEMATEEQQHAAILMACKAITENFLADIADPGAGLEKANEFKRYISSYLSKGTPSMTIEESLKIAVEIEGSEINSIYSRLVDSLGPDIARTIEQVTGPTGSHRRKLAAAVSRFTRNAELRAAADNL